MVGDDTETVIRLSLVGQQIQREAILEYTDRFVIPHGCDQRVGQGPARGVAMGMQNPRRPVAPLTPQRHAAVRVQIKGHPQLCQLAHLLRCPRDDAAHDRLVTQTRARHHRVTQVPFDIIVLGVRDSGDATLGIGRVRLIQRSLGQDHNITVLGGRQRSLQASHTTTDDDDIRKEMRQQGRAERDQIATFVGDRVQWIISRARRPASGLG